MLNKMLNLQDLEVFSELLQKIHDSVPLKLFPSICSLVEKSIHKISSVLLCQEENPCYLYDTDPDEENIFPQFPPMSIPGSPMNKSLLDISSYKIRSLKHNNDSSSLFPNPSQTFKDIIWKEIESNKPVIDISEPEVVDMFKVLQLGLSSLATELGNTKT